MNAGCRHAADRCFRRVQPPIAGIERDELVMAEIAFDLLESSQLSRQRHREHFGHRRFKALLMTHAEHELAFGAGVDGGFGSFPGQGQRLFAEDVLPGGDGALDLLGVERMRRGQDDGLHPGMPEGRLDAGMVREAIGGGELLPGRIGLGGADDLDILLRLLQHGGHLLAPPAEADHRDFDGVGLAHVSRAP